MDDSSHDEHLSSGQHQPNTAVKNKNQLRLAVDYRLLVVILLLVIAGMLAVWKPWVAAKTSDRTITVTGEASLQAKPGEYVFYPSYEFTDADKQTALGELTKQSDTVVSKLKSLGVSDGQIKTDSSGGGRNYYNYVLNDDKTTTYTLTFTVTVDSSDLAQKVQDYLATTSPSGSVSPQTSFSDAQQKTLDNQARDAASNDARAKAEQSAKNLGFHLGTVKSVTDGAGFNQIEPLSTMSMGVSAASDAKEPSLAVQPGLNKLNYSVNVVYYIH